MDNRELLAQRNQNNPFSNHVGVRTLEISTGRAVAELEVRPEHLNMFGAVHGGCLFTLADITAGSAVASHDVKAVTADAAYHYLAASKDVKTIIAVAQTIKVGKTLIVTEVELRTDGNTLVGKGTFTHCCVK